jgi:hypothetical protein
MKKFVIGFILLLIAAACVLIIGFVTIPIDYYGVIQTRISGFDEKVYPPGTRLWRWEKLLPTVFTLYKFKILPHRTELASPIKGSLYPSGNDYARALGEDFDFSFELTVTVEFVINTEELVPLVKDGLRPDNLTAWYKKIADKLAERLLKIVLDEPDIFMKYNREEYLKHIKGIISDEKNFFGITLIAVDPKNVNIPDYDAYKTLKERYFEDLAYKTEIRREMMEAEKQLYLEAIEKEIEIIRNIDRYGEVITKYPEILEFLKETNKGYLKESMNTTGITGE